MKIKTIKLKQGEYTNFTTEFDEHDVIMLIGARGRGKSYPTAKYVKKILQNDLNAKFAYMRIKDEELATYYGWCNDLDLPELAGSEDYELQRGKPVRGDITLTSIDSFTGRAIDSRTIGKCISLLSSHLYKSGKYDEYKAIVFEEFTHKDLNIDIEKKYVFNFLENVITIFRNRPKKIFLLSNTLQTIPLLETAITELTGELFVNPLKIKIFGDSGGSKNNFINYLNGEIFVDDDFSVYLDEFYTVYVNKEYIIKKHKIYPKKYYVSFNKTKEKLIMGGNQYIDLKYFLQLEASNEFYFQDNKTEISFRNSYRLLIREITHKAAVFGAKYFI